MMTWKMKKFNELNTREVYEILKLRNEVFIVEQKCPYADCDGKDMKAYHLFLDNGGEIAAYLRILKRGVFYDEISIGRVLVNSKYRGRGFAREMMEKAIRFVQEQLNENEIRIEAQAYLIDFYKSFGFKQVSQVFLEDNIPHIEMLYKESVLRVKMEVNMIIKSCNKASEEVIKDIRELEVICKEHDGIKEDIFLDKSINFNDNMESLFLLYEYNKLISLISMFVPTQSEAEISAYTLPEYRQKGYFKELLIKAVDELQKYSVLDILFVCESQSVNAKEVIKKLEAKYDFTEYLLSYNKLNADMKHEIINSIELQKANLKDTKTLINISQKIFNDSYEDAESMITKAFNSQTREQYIAVAGNINVGMCSVSFEGKEASIFGLGILPEYQGKGYGKYMLNLLVRNLVQRNIDNILIEVDSTNKRAFNLYKNHGFDIEVAFDYYRKRI